MKIIGIDLDGTITSHGFYNPNIPLPWWLWYFLIPFVLLSKPKKAIVKKMQLMAAQGYQFVILTRRPEQFSQFTERRLKPHCVPHLKLFCVGIGRGANERKLKIVQEQKIERFVDSDKRIVRFMRRNSVNAVNSLDEFFD